MKILFQSWWNILAQEARSKLELTVGNINQKSSVLVRSGAQDNAAIRRPRGTIVALIWSRGGG